MDQSRRDVLKAGGGVGIYAALVSLGLINPSEVSAADWNKAAFETKNVADAVKSLGGSTPTMTDQITVTAPDIAENGAVVPVAAVSKLPKTTRIAFLIENNPNTITAIFDIPPGTMAEVQTRVKMGKTSNVMALVEADGKWYAAQKEVKVTVGGCGG